MRHDPTANTAIAHILRDDPRQRADYRRWLAEHPKEWQAGAQTRYRRAAERLQVRFS